jgi:LPXTG-site transpeptidase (sortase) family protein
MRLCKKLNPFAWDKKTIILAFLAFYLLTIPLYFSGLSAFATTINPVNATLRIPSIGLSTPVTPTKITPDGLATPEKLVASYTDGNTVFLYAHSTTAFRNLHQLQLGRQITYIIDGQPQNFTVTNLKTLPKSTINMNKLLTSTPEKTLILMTCAGTPLRNGDYSDRLVLWAKSE